MLWIRASDVVVFDLLEVNGSDYKSEPADGS